MTAHAPAPKTAAQAEADVVLARADLTATLDQLRDALQPSHLAHEVMARPRDAASHGLAVFNRFAKHSPLSRVIIGATTLLIAVTAVRGGARR